VTLGGDTFANDLISIYKGINDDYITIEGLSNSLTNNVNIYNLLGQLMANKSLNVNQTKQTVSTKGFSSGIYVVELQSGRSVVAKKIIVK
jgi:adenine C2-methylase RlmN of 23S rRNA A2503 and tRNA A37